MGIAVITGASSGIGEEFAVQLDLSKKYNEIWLIARRKDRLEKVAKRLSSPSKIIVLDLEKAGAVTKLEETLTAENKTVSLLVNSAGFGLNGDFHELDLQEQLSMIDLNCRAIVELTHMATPFMTKGSRFINISSIAGAAPLGSFALYGASKSFLTSFSVSISAELKPLGIGMTIVTPGSVNTEFQKRSRGKSGRKKKLFAKKATAQEVVTHALNDASKDRLFSIYGFGAKFAMTLGRFLPPYPMARLAYTKIYPKNSK